MKNEKEKEINVAREDFPGTAIDADKKGDVTKKDVESDVKRLNNNPRNDQ